ncbi:MAG TPA: hypothetical protein VF950_11075 [Planctomycetota bacterium]
MIALFALLLQDETLLKELEGSDIPRVYRALETLAAGSPDARAALGARAAASSGRLKSHLLIAARGPVAPARRITLAGPSRSVLEWAQELARRADLPLNWDALVDEKLPEVALEARDVLPFEALAALGRAADLGVSWEEGQILLFTGGYVDAPASRFGSTQLTLVRFKQERVVEFATPSRETAELEATLAFEPSLPLLEVLGARVLEARDDKGADVLAPPEAQEERPDAGPLARPEALIASSLTIKLRPLSRGARGLAVLRGEIDIRLPRALRRVEIARPETGATAKGRGFSVKVVSLIPQESRALLEIAILDEALRKRPVIVTGCRADGRRERTLTSLVEVPDQGPIRVMLEIQPRGPAIRLDKEPMVPLDLLRVEVAEDVDERALPFEYRGVTLR